LFYANDLSFLALPCLSRDHSIFVYPLSAPAPLCWCPGSAIDPTGGAYSASPNPIDGFKGHTSTEKEGRGMERGREERNMEKGGKGRKMGIVHPLFLA